MTTDQHASDALRALIREPVELSEEGLRAVLAAVPDTPQQRSWLPQSPKWRFQTMFSATRFVVASAIVALFGGFLLAGVLMQPSDESVPAATPSGPGTFSPAGSLSVPRTFHTATLLPDDRVFVIGGTGRPSDDGTAQEKLEVWDPATVSFSLVGPRAGERCQHTATLMPDGPRGRDHSVLVVGGHGEGQDEVTSLWLPAPRLEEGITWGKGGPATEGGRGEHTATLLPDARVLVVGGVGEFDKSLASAEVWDRDQERHWSLVGSLNEARTEHTATLLTDGRVLVVGGATDRDESLASAEIWDPVTETFSPTGSLGSARESHTATLLADGRVLVVGGRLQGSSVPSAEVWDPVTGVFGPSGALADARAGHTATLLADGRVLVVGGRGPRDAAVASAEVWDPANESFGPAATLAYGRYGHTATLLKDGRVLIVGGEALDDLVSSAEIWSPAIDEPAADAVADDSTPPDLLPGVDLVTEEVEPGVYRVLSDGIRDLSDLLDLDVPIEADSDGECRGGFLVEGECWFDAYGMLVREVDGEFPIEQVPDAEHGLTFPAQEVIGPLPGSGDTGWLVITGPTGFQGLLGYGPQGWMRVPYAADEDGQAPSIETGGGCGVVLGPARYPGLVGPDGTAWVYTLEREGLHVTAWDGDSWSSFGPVDISTPDVEDPCLLLDAAFGPNGTMWFTTRRIPLYVITPEAVAVAE